MKNCRQILIGDGSGSFAGDGEKWIDKEVAGCQFRDVRHGKRMRQLLEQFSTRVGAMTPWAAQDWANTKAAYRFFANRRISEANILAGHFASTRERCGAVSGFPLLILHDTTELSYRHKDTAPIGIVMKTVTGASKPGRSITPAAAFWCTQAW